ncbi:MAG: beta-lactamase [Gemmatimonadetes bacterium]|nr:beta-lactamase [Gemmatimonadota bacterium]
MSIRRRACVAALHLTLVLTSASLHALAAQQSVPADLPARVDQIFARFTRTTPGCGVGLSKDGRPLYIHGYGMANLEYGVPNSDSTVFESGSVAKQFTASAIVMLARDGKLSLDDDIRKYLPEVPTFGGQKITIRNLLTHTSGLRDQWGLLGIEGRGPGSQVHTPMTTLDLVVHQKMLNFPPGSEYLYSNTGYALAGIIVQRVSGKTLQDFSQERFFGPLGMTHTLLRDDYTRVVPNRATAYSGSAATGFHQDMPFTNMVGNGGVLSTIGDLLRWNENLDRPAVGGSEYVTAMETPMRLTSGRAITYALGLTVAPYRGLREVGHSGSTAGYSTYMSRFPDQRVAVVVWCNGAGTNATALAHQVADLVLPTSDVNAAGAAAEHVDVPAALVAKWAGTYRDPHTDQTVTLTASNNSLVQADGRGRGNAGFMAMGGARFKGPVGDAEFGGQPGRRTLTLVRAGADTAHFEEVRAAAGAVPLNDYVGTYTSDELDMRYTVVSRGGKLYVTRRPYEEFELRPVYTDDFAAGGGLGTLRFARGGKGAVTGFSFFAGRVLDVRFKRVGR